MANLSFNFENIVASKKCAVSSPRIVNLEIGDESPDSASESTFQDFFDLDEISRDVKKNSNSASGCDMKSDKNSLIHSYSSVSTFTCDDRSSNKIKATSDGDIHFDLLNLLNSAELKQTVVEVENFNSKKNTCNDKMKITSNAEVSDLSNIVHEISKKNQVVTIFQRHPRKDSKDCEIDLLNFDFVKNECSNSLSSNKSYLKVEGNLSDLLSSINLEDSDVTKGGSCNSNVNKFKTVKEPCVEDLSDLLSSIDLGDSKIDDSGNHYGFGTGNESSLLLSTDVDKSNIPLLRKEPCVDNMFDLSSTDLENLYSKIDIIDEVNTCNTNVTEIKNKSSLSGALSFKDVEKIDMPASTILNNKSLSLGNSNMCFKDIDGASNLLNDFTLDLTSSSSSSNSYSSSYSEQENNSPKEFFTENNLTDKLESDSGYSSFESLCKEFSFFDYSSDNKISLNTLLSNKSDANIAMKNCNNEELIASNEEMSMSDLMSIVSPEFKSSVLATSIKTTKLQNDVNQDSSSMLGLIECLNTKSKNSDSHVTNNSSVELNQKLMNYDCVDSPLSKSVLTSLKKINFKVDASLKENDEMIGKNNYVNDSDKVVNDEGKICVIDLRECVKSTKHEFIPSLPIKQLKSVENYTSKHLSPQKIILCCEDILTSDLSQNRSNPFEFNNMVARKRSRINTKQSMFSKALACKPKKDQCLLQKVANIKNELLKNIIHRPVFIGCNVPQPTMENVLQSDRCILSNVGRRSFGLDVPCEFH